MTQTHDFTDDLANWPTPEELAEERWEKPWRYTPPEKKVELPESEIPF
jgi:hypothetical protein